MKEIAGYFGLEQLISNEYYKDLIPLNTGRNALLYLLKAKNIKKVYIPYYLCNSISDMLKKNRYDFEYYKISPKFMPVFNKRLEKNEHLFVVNYYGQLTKEKILSLKRRYKNIILDNTHAFFQKPLKGIDTIYSCRKFFGVPDGAYLSTGVTLNEDLEVDISKDRMEHILGRYEGTASDYYSKFKENDSFLKTEPLKYMSKLTHNILGAIDYERIRRARNENFTYLQAKLGIYNKIKIKTPDGAFAYPFFIEEGIPIRKGLIKKKIYVPILWPNVLTDTSEGSIENYYAANILPLPCDQRYTIKDMYVIISCINNIQQ